MTWQWFITWWNLIFIVPFGVALLYLGFSTVSGIGFSDGDADADSDADADADTDADADVDADADADADADGDADSEAATEAPAGGGSGAPLHLAALGWLGLGRIPVSLILIVLLMSWGAIGFFANALLFARCGAYLPAVSLPLAALGSLLATRGLVRFIGRFMPLDETYAHRRHELLGLVGEAVFDIDEKFGMATVRDSQGDLFQVACRVEAGKAKITKGQKLQFIAYNRQGWFSVAPYDPKTSAAPR